MNKDLFNGGLGILEIILGSDEIKAISGNAPYSIDEADALANRDYNVTIFLRDLVFYIYDFRHGNYVKDIFKENVQTTKKLTASRDCEAFIACGFMAGPEVDIEEGSSFDHDIRIAETGWYITQLR